MLRVEEISNYEVDELIPPLHNLANNRWRAPRRSLSDRGTRSLGPHPNWVRKVIGQAIEDHRQGLVRNFVVVDPPTSGDGGRVVGMAAVETGAILYVASPPRQSPTPHTPVTPRRSQRRGGDSNVCEQPMAAVKPFAGPGAEVFRRILNPDRRAARVPASLGDTCVRAWVRKSYAKDVGDVFGQLALIAWQDGSVPWTIAPLNSYLRPSLVAVGMQPEGEPRPYIIDQEHYDHDAPPLSQGYVYHGPRLDITAPEPLY